MGPQNAQNQYLVAHVNMFSWEKISMTMSTCALSWTAFLHANRRTTLPSLSMFFVVVFFFPKGGFNQL